MNQLLKNKKGLILGVANDNSISWGIAKVEAFTMQSLACMKELGIEVDKSNLNGGGV